MDTEKLSVCQQVFGKKHNELTPTEALRFKRIAAQVDYYRRYVAVRETNRGRHRSRKLEIIRLLGISAECQRCGYNKYIGALDFHHLDRSDKEFSVLSKGLSEGLREARKCELICANCHREEHAGDENPTGAGRPRKDDPLLEKYLAAVGIVR